MISSGRNRSLALTCSPVLGPTCPDSTQHVDSVQRGERDYVTGSQPYAFSWFLTLSENERHHTDRDSRGVELALVSLLRHDEQCVYKTENLPNLKELSSQDVPTRPLDEFE